MELIEQTLNFLMKSVSENTFLMGTSKSSEVPSTVSTESFLNCENVGMYTNFTKQKLNFKIFTNKIMNVVVLNSSHLQLLNFRTSIGQGEKGKIINLGVIFDPVCWLGFFPVNWS